MTEINAFERASQWAKNPYFDQESRQEIQGLIDQQQKNEIIERFYKDLEFGTGGMRSILGQGTNRMNKYNIRKATHALSQVILENTPQNQQAKAVLCYDSRRFSFEFAQEAAGVFAANNIQALIFEQLNPVALTSFAIRFYEATAGVMVTASHNPPEYNGYKVFWSDGAQVIPPIDQSIIDCFNNITDYAQIPHMPFEMGLATGRIQWIGPAVENAYFEKVQMHTINPQLCHEHGHKLGIVYTPLHGTGLKPCLRILQEMGMTNVAVVQAQAQPDGNFPTVKSPNPENPEALAMAVELMKKNEADLALGSDPDTDRMGVALQHEGATVYLSGNQIGILMLHYILSNLSERNSLPKNSYFIKTIVTTPLQETIAKRFNVAVENTLTGFKWICGRLREIEQQAPQRNFLFATEESFGYLHHPHVRDKDGVSSIALISEIALWYKLKGKNLIQALDQIYEEFGFSNESLLSLDYFGREGAEKINRIMEHFRANCKESFMDQSVELREDYQLKQKWEARTNTTSPLEFPKSNVLGYHLHSGERIYLRPSGTEPKIKFYIMIQVTEGSLEHKKQKARQKSEDIINFIKAKADKA